MISEFTKNLLKKYLEEDVGEGDLTSLALLDPSLEASAKIITREKIIVCGLGVAREVFLLQDPSLSVELLLKDGDVCKAGGSCLTVSGCFSSILTAERLVLNLMQHLSGISTQTARFVELVSDTSVTLLDTRKTTPGLRELEKYAVRCGGGRNHRIALDDAVLIKNNHVDALGGDVALAISKARESVLAGIKVAVEVRDMQELAAAVPAKPDAILLDNMSPVRIEQAICYVRAQVGGEQIELEASGGINEKNLLAYAETGIDSISLGCLTHSVRAVDLALHYAR